mgnify:FL=1
MTTIPDITLNDERTIPQLGFGTYQIPPGDTSRAVVAALEAGYRHIDTAEMYDNEAGVGDGVRASGLSRSEVFVTSKLSNAYHRPDDGRREFDRTLEALQSDYVDLFLIHWPLPMLYDGDYVSTWRLLEEFQRDGRARSIGVSNFKAEHLDRLAAETDTVPAVNQIEAHPYFLNDGIRAYGADHGIVTQAWSPLAQGACLTDAAVVDIATRLARTPSQVVLRWHIQRGDVVFPKTLSPERMRQNLDLFGFELSAEDMAALAALDKGETGRTGPHPDTFDFVPG